MAQIVLNDAVEGEHEVINDYFFHRLCEPIPVMPRNGGDGDPMPYDREYLPSQALAVSERFLLLFVAHPSGFVVARILDVMWAQVWRWERSVRSSSIVEVPVGRVRLLSLSPESSTLAACVGGTVNLFSVASLYRQEQEPFLSPTIEGGSSIKDVSWLNEHSYILLSSCGNLYVGRMDGSLEFLMDNVDAVDCSPGADYIAMARNDELRILSPRLNEESHIALSLQPWMGNSDDSSVKGCTTTTYQNFLFTRNESAILIRLMYNSFSAPELSSFEVDSLKWACPDRIILGCFQLTLDGMEESYLLLVIGLTVSEILPKGETTSTRLALSVDYVQSFHDVFPGIVEDIMPAGSGPHLFFSCLRNHNFAIAANRKNVDEHVVLFDWRHREQMARVYIDRDYWLPRIELQENGDDNSILGLCINEISQDRLDRINRFFHQTGFALVIPGDAICILWCLSLEGKLSAFSVTR
ncbi:hypothetical protein EUGRSUZ_J01742 [Eucalyptus grandis]|uniref:Uncharacterized protein n=2 Tax=Eucalyptus grandis TaxID=71139 RepID=A0ACC3J6I1_EUCGR|nr:hypothetical protein EUGRSUZ_J01742 [Eucalyptus grandis]